MAECSCGCGGVKLLYACSGAANTGFLADAVWRKLMDGGMGKSSCLAAVGAGLSGFIESAKCAAKNVVIDGCPVGCGKKIFENNGLPFQHVVMTDYGVQKGKTEITRAVIDRVAEEVGAKI